MELITLIGAITVFILAIFLGFELITKVPATLHTPLMSGANAITPHPPRLRPLGQL